MSFDLVAETLRPGQAGFGALCVLGYLMFASGLTYALFGLDKQRAIRGDQRIPEASLLAMAALGGWPGAKAAQARFRHKTRKQPFANVLNLIVAGQVALFVAYGTPVGEVVAALADTPTDAHAAGLLADDAALEG
ncbi:MAG TPA: DUF1294 domain-containing protein [Paracoccaceae bacterium]|nr:DUF1294 domain-containing protein [Paracoccaceae bacterium]